MRSIPRSQPPATINFNQYRRQSKDWADWATSQDYPRLVDVLREEFGGICAYCEGFVRPRSNPGPVDHFRPRNPAVGSQEVHFGRNVTFEWSNLMYACPKCQKAKDNKWPGTGIQLGEDLVNVCLSNGAANEGWIYTAVTVTEGYVNPNEGKHISSEDFLEYQKYGNILPSTRINDSLRSKAKRTIYDIQLNESVLVQERENHYAEIAQFVDSKGELRRVTELQRQVARHRRRKLKDSLRTAYNPPVKHTGFILYAHQNGWF